MSARRTGLGAALAVALIPAALWCAEVVCPVCGQHFTQAPTNCPNDGTDLTAVGKPLEPDADDTDTDEDDPTAESPPGANTPTHPAGNNAAPAPRYRRTDQGGSRQRLPVAPGEALQDRRSRIGEERRAYLPEKNRNEKPDERALIAEEQQRLQALDEERRRAWNDDRARQQRLEAATEAARLARASERLLERSAPLVALGFRLFLLGEDGHPGPVPSAQLDANLTNGFVRAGLTGSIGGRSLPDRSDLVVAGGLSLGLEWPARFAPFLLVRAEIGALTGGRGEGSDTALLRGIGLEAGVDAHLTSWLVLTPAVGYERFLAGDDSWNTLTARLSVGF